MLGSPSGPLSYGGAGPKLGPRVLMSQDRLFALLLESVRHSPGTSVLTAGALVWRGCEPSRPGPQCQGPLQQVCWQNAYLFGALRGPVCHERLLLCEQDSRAAVLLLPDPGGQIPRFLHVSRHSDRVRRSRLIRYFLSGDFKRN